MAWVQIAPGIYINQNLTGAAGGAGQAAANNFAAQQRAAAQRAAQLRAQQNAAAAQASARASRDRLRRVGRADSAARRSLQILGQNTADQTRARAKRLPPGRRSQELLLVSGSRLSHQGLLLA